MTTAGDGRASCARGRAGDKFHNRIFRPEINEEPHNVAEEAGRNNSTGASELSSHQGANFACFCSTFGKSELEQMLKQMNFTRSETQHFIELLQSRTIEESPSPLSRLEASTTTGSLKTHKHGDDRVNFNASVVCSRVLEEEIASPAVLIKAYKGSTSGTAPSKTSVGSPQHSVTMENLPEELLSNIFIRLLAKQLAQMRSVSKSWNALLSHPSFVKSHIHHSIHEGDQVLLIFSRSSGVKPFVAKPSRSPRFELTQFIQLPVNPQSEYTNGIWVISSVNGLICSVYDNGYDSVIHIWNPSLSARITLPPYLMPSYCNKSIEVHFRFGFDPTADDYKVVKLAKLYGNPTYAVNSWLQVEIYSMRRGSWEFITERFPSHVTNIVNTDYVCVDGHDGHLHWIGITNEIHSETIVAFDLGTETFREIPFPDSILDYNRLNILGVLAEKLCVMSFIEGDALEVWVMDEYGVAESWVKHLVFSQFSGDICPFGFTSHSELLIEDNGNLVLYDSSANRLKTFQNHCAEKYGVNKIVEYVDSLVWVAPADADREMVGGVGQNQNVET